jgi:hypothetical protein
MIFVQLEFAWQELQSPAQMATHAQVIYVM